MATVTFSLDAVALCVNVLGETRPSSSGVTSTVYVLPLCMLRMLTVSVNGNGESGSMPLRRPTTFEVNSLPLSVMTLNITYPVYPLTQSLTSMRASDPGLIAMG
jgi:hypothetical protein